MYVAWSTTDLEVAMDHLVEVAVLHTRDDLMKESSGFVRAKLVSWSRHHINKNGRVQQLLIRIAHQFKGVSYYHVESMKRRRVWR